MRRKVCLLKRKKESRVSLHMIPRVFQVILNMSLVFLGIVLSFLLVKELVMFSQLLLTSENSNHKTFLESILIFFLYFEFITMIVKYFEEEYHFPLRYFIYIGITAMIRLIIVDHKDPMTTLLYSLIILISHYWLFYYEFNTS